MNMTDAVAIISKIPRLGRTKTRLARTVGAPSALDLHRAFLADEIAQLHAPEDWRLHVVHEAPEDEAEQRGLASLFAGRAASVVSSGGGLAHALNDAFVALLAEHERAVIISADVPHVQPEVVRRAFDALNTADVVLGAGPDGGYYLVGLRHPHDLFTPVTMSNGRVAMATIALARRMGLQVVQVASMTDVDEAQDLLVLEHAPSGVALQSRAVVAGLARFEHGVSLPSELQVEATSRCNLSCSACLRTHESLAPDADLTLDDFVSIVSDIPRLERVTFQLNGESLMNPALPAMITHAASKGAHTLLNTNGTLLDANRRAALLGSGLHELRVSLDGAAVRTVLHMAGADVFERVVGNVGAFVKARGSTPSPVVSFWMVLTRANIGDLPRLVSLAARIGVDEVYTQRLVLNGHGVAVKASSLHGAIDDEVLDAVAAAEEIAAANGVSLRASGRRPVLESLTPSTDPNPWLACWRPWRSAVVTASKKVLPCCISTFRAPYEELEMGDLSTQSWREVWNGERYRAVRRGLLAAEPQPYCAGCNVDWSL